MNISLDVDVGLRRILGGINNHSKRPRSVSLYSLDRNKEGIFFSSLQQSSQLADE